MSRWFRHYAGMMRDDKLVRVAIRSGQTIERVVWIYAAILESAAEVDDAGRYDFDAAEAAYFLRADEGDVLAIVEALAAANHVAESRVVKWGDRQFNSDRSATRQAAYRERKRREVSGGDVTPSDGGVTSLSRHSDAPDTETELETEQSSDADASGAIAPLPQPIDLKATVFNSGSALLVSKGMKSDRDARSLLGRLRSKYGDAPVIDALAVLQRSSPSDVAPYLVEILETRYGQRNSLRGTRPDPSLDLMRQGIAEERAERGPQAPDRRTRPALPAIGTG